MEAMEFKKVIDWLGTYYSKKLTNDTMMAYFMKLKDYPIDRLKKACSNLVDKSEFFPSIALIKKELDEIASNAPQIERKSFYMGDWDVPVELPPKEVVEAEVERILKERELCKV